MLPGRRRGPDKAGWLTREAGSIVRASCTNMQNMQERARRNRKVQLLTDERHQIIRAQLAAKGRVLAGELAARFGVSEDTVRRDLRELAKVGQCRRVYGGAVAPAPFAGPLSVRSSQASEEKARLASAAVKLLSPRQTLFIDGGTTNIAIARAIPQDLELTVATNSVGVASALSEHGLVDLIMLGGSFDRELGACVGGDTLRAVAAAQRRSVLPRLLRRRCRSRRDRLRFGRSRGQAGDGRATAPASSSPRRPTSWPPPRRFVSPVPRRSGTSWSTGPRRARFWRSSRSKVRQSISRDWTAVWGPPSRPCRDTIPDLDGRAPGPEYQTVVWWAFPASLAAGSRNFWRIPPDLPIVRV